MRFGWIPVAGNIRQPEAVERLFETRKRFGKLDIFVSGWITRSDAGPGSSGPMQMGVPNCASGWLGMPWNRWT